MFLSFNHVFVTSIVVITSSLYFLAGSDGEYLGRPIQIKLLHNDVPGLRGPGMPGNTPPPCTESVAEWIARHRNALRNDAAAWWRLENQHVYPPSHQTWPLEMDHLCMTDL